MKKLLLSTTLLISMSAFSQEIKQCKATIEFPGDAPLVHDVRITKKGNDLLGTVIQTVGGETVEHEEMVKIHQFEIKHNLSEYVGRTIEREDGLNLGESYIILAMTFEGDFMGEPSPFKTGIPLELVKSVKLYEIGKETVFGSVMLVEAYDQEGKELGTYFHALAVAACE